MARIGRNAPCPCHSGRKYKKCCLDADRAAASAPVGEPSGPITALTRFDLGRAPSVAHRVRRAPVQQDLPAIDFSRGFETPPTHFTTEALRRARGAIDHFVRGGGLQAIDGALDFVREVGPRTGDAEVDRRLGVLLTDWLLYDASRYAPGSRGAPAELAEALRRGGDDEAADALAAMAASTMWLFDVDAVDDTHRRLRLIPNRGAGPDGEPIEVIDAWVPRDLAAGDQLYARVLPAGDGQLTLGDAVLTFRAPVAFFGDPVYLSRCAARAYADAARGSAAAAA